MKKQIILVLALAFFGVNYAQQAPVVTPASELFRTALKK
jgi:hypothetical protein